MSSLSDAQHRLASARRIAVLTGAGISADSGVPTFRGADGLWRNFRAEDLATPEAFARDPRLVWEWYDWRRALIAKALPNEAHHALVRLEQRAPDYWLITQNVDGLHRQAGSTKISEIHGNIWMTRCTSCRLVREDRTVPLTILPHCGACGGLLRPHIVWFGESLAADDIQRSQDAATSCDCFLIVGTSGLVYPAASFAAIAKQAGAYVIEVNLDPTPQSTLVDVSLQGRAKDLLPLLVVE